MTGSDFYDKNSKNDVLGSNQNIGNQDAGVRMRLSDVGYDRFDEQQLKKMREKGLVELQNMSQKHNGALDAIQEEG